METGGAGSAQASVKQACQENDQCFSEELLCGGVEWVGE